MGRVNWKTYAGFGCMLACAGIWAGCGSTVEEPLRFELQQLDEGGLPASRLVVLWYHPDVKADEGGVEVAYDQAFLADVKQLSLDTLLPPNESLRLTAPCDADLPCDGELDIAIASIALIRDANGNAVIEVDEANDPQNLHGLADVRIVYSNQDMSGGIEGLSAFPAGLVEGIAAYSIVRKEGEKDRLTPLAKGQSFELHICANPGSATCNLPFADVF